MEHLKIIELLRTEFNSYINLFKYEPYNRDQAIERTIDHFEKVVETMLRVTELNSYNVTH